MFRIGLWLILLGNLVIACNNTPKQRAMDEDNIQGQSKAEPIPQKPVMYGDSAIVHIPLKNGKGNLFLHKEADQTIYVRFESKGYKKIRATLSSPDSTANIRFSQIFLPDGTMDGPFSRDLAYDLPVDGNYQVSIHENMMAGDPWSGNFNVSIELQL